MYRHNSKKSQEKYNTHNNDKKQKAGPAAFVESGALHNVFHGQGLSVFHTVNTLVLCPMVHEHSLDILHLGNQKQISQKEQDSQMCIRDRFRSAFLKTMSLEKSFI